MKLTFKNILIYLLGLILMSLGVTLMKRTFLGMGAWDAVITNLQFITKLKLGYASLIINICLLLFVMIYRKSFKYLNVIVPIIINTLLLNLWDSFIFKDLVFNELWLRILIFGLSTLLLPFGLSLIIISTLPKMIYDELTFALMEIFKTDNFGRIRLGFEISGIIIAMIFGLIGGDILMQIGYGSIVVTLLIGTLIDLFLKMFNYNKEIGNII